MPHSDIILVNTHDQAIGSCDKLTAHQQGLLHRAFSVFILNSQGEILLQQRQHDKYHCGGLWTNSCCSHPRVGETILQAATRRVQEELGIVPPDLHEVGHFIYRAEFSNGLIEHELDHVLVGLYLGPVNQFDPTEVAAVQWVSPTALLKDLQQHPERYTPWLAEALALVMGTSKTGF